MQSELQILKTTKITITWPVNQSNTSFKLMRKRTRLQKQTFIHLDTSIQNQTCKMFNNHAFLFDFFRWPTLLGSGSEWPKDQVLNRLIGWIGHALLEQPSKTTHKIFFSLLYFSFNLDCGSWNLQCYLVLHVHNMLYIHKILSGAYLGLLNCGCWQ